MFSWKSWEVAEIKLWVLICLKPTVLEPLDHHWSSIFVDMEGKNKNKNLKPDIFIALKLLKRFFQKQKKHFFRSHQTQFLVFPEAKSSFPAKKYHSHSKKLSYDKIQNTQMTRVTSAKNEAFISKYRGNSFLVALLLNIWMAWTD